MKKAKKAIIQVSAEPVNEVVVKTIKKVTDVKAVGTTVLLEMLSSEEAAGSSLATVGKSQQGRILDIGPALEVDKYGFKKGQRVLLQGTFVPIPKFPGGDKRDLVVVDPHMIKCAFVEA